MQIHVKFSSEGITFSRPNNEQINIIQHVNVVGPKSLHDLSDVSLATICNLLWEKTGLFEFLEDIGRDKLRHLRHFDAK